jgi:hypothetical protein
LNEYRRSCPVCYKDFYWQEYKDGKSKICSDFKRINVNGFLWWGKKCPIGGAHYHKWCKCGAVVVEMIISPRVDEFRI